MGILFEKPDELGEDKVEIFPGTRSVLSGIISDPVFRYIFMSGNNRAGYRNIQFPLVKR